MALGHVREHPDEERIRPIANTRPCGRSSREGLGRPRTAQAWSSWRPSSSRRSLEAEVHDEVGRGASGRWSSTGGGRRGTGSLEPARSGRRCPARRSSSPGGEVALTSQVASGPCTTSQPRAGQASPPLSASCTLRCCGSARAGWPPVHDVSGLHRLTGRCLRFEGRQRIQSLVGGSTCRP